MELYPHPIEYGPVQLVSELNPLFVMNDEHDHNKEITEKLITIHTEYPFPFTDLMSNPRKHYILDRPNTYKDVTVINNFITNSMFKSLIQWMGDNFWFNKTPFIHGDLSKDNITVTPGKIWVLDYENAESLNPAILPFVNMSIEEIQTSDLSLVSHDFIKIFIDCCELIESVIYSNDVYNEYYLKRLDLEPLKNEYHKILPIFKKVSTGSIDLQELTELILFVLSLYKYSKIVGGKRRYNFMKTLRINALESIGVHYIIDANDCIKHHSNNYEQECLN